MINFIKKSLILASLLPSIAFAQEEYATMKFQFADDNPTGKVFIRYNLYGPFITDSIQVSNKIAEFKIAAKNPTQVTLSYSKDGKANKNTVLEDVRTIYIQNGTATISIKDAIKTASITGMPIVDSYEHYLNYIKPSEDQFAILKNEYEALTAEQKADLTYTKPLFAKQDTLAQFRKKLLTQFINENPNSHFSTHGLRGIYHLLTPQEFDKLFYTLSVENQNSSVGALLNEYLKAAKVAGIGQMAPDFTQNDVNGNPVKLSDFKGQYVLLDFWASWCAPCRAENPNVVKEYNKYKDKGFTVLGVSLDSPNGKNAWLKAIEDDKLTWTNVSDLKGWKNEASNLYMVRAVPQNYLIDPTGKIIAINLKGYKLGEKLDEIFNKK